MSRLAVAVATVAVLVLAAVAAAPRPHPRPGLETVTLREQGAETGCPGEPGDPDGADGWGGCWPGPVTTGVPRGARLTQVPAEATRGDGWTWVAEDRILEVDDDGVVLEDLEVDGGVYVRGTGVTVRGSRARFVATASGSRAGYCHAGESEVNRTVSECSFVTGLSDDTDPATNDPRLRIQDSEIDYRGRPGDTGTCVTGRNIDVVRVDLHGCENGFDADSYVTITDSYIHDLYNSDEGDPHTDGLQSGVGDHLLLDHNVFFGFTTGCTFPDENGSCNGTSAVNIGGQPDVATAVDTTVRRNLLAGGAYTVYCPLQPPSGFVLTENTFSTVFSATARDPAVRDRVGAFGVADGCGRPGVTATGNLLLDRPTGTTTPLSLGARDPG